MEQARIYEYFRSLHADGKLMDKSDTYAMDQVYSRLSRILKWDLEADHLPTDNRYAARRSEAKIRQLLYLFEQWFPVAEDRDSIDSSGLSTIQLVAYGLAKLCYWYWVEDSNLIRQVLTQIYECDKNFSYIFMRAIDEFERRPIVWCLSKNSTTEKEFSFVVYFLHHAHRSRLMYEGVRFVDIELAIPIQVPPAMAAAVYCKPEALILFLRYGALLYGDYLSRNAMQHEWDVSFVLRHLLRTLWSRLGYQMVSSPHTNVVVTNPMQNICMTISTLLRAIPQVDPEGLHFPFTAFEHARFTHYIRSELFIRWVSSEGLLPTLAFRCFQPSHLQHLCRCKIRSVLNKQWRLPCGIYLLNIPKLLKNYLDLYED